MFPSYGAFKLLINIIFPPVERMSPTDSVTPPPPTSGHACWDRVECTFVCHVLKCSQMTSNAV